VILESGRKLREVRRINFDDKELTKKFERLGYRSDLMLQTLNARCSDMETIPVPRWLTEKLRSMKRVG
jgi:hypothetical protein